MATNKKITDLTELSEVDLADDDMLAIVDVSAGTTNKVRKSTLASALSGVSSITAATPIAVDQSTGAVIVSTGTIPITKGGTGATDAAAALTALGGVAGPASSTDNAVARFDSTTGKLIQNSTVTISDTGDITATSLNGILGSGTPAAATVTTLTASGVTTVAAGAAALPSIVPTGDTNTGVWFPAADTVAASTAGTERMRIDSSGNVGIGTSAPSSMLEISNAGDDTNVIVMSQGGNYKNSIQNSHSASASIARMSFFVHDSSTTQANVMSLLGNGNVGIGTSSPAVLLDVLGDALIQRLRSTTSTAAYLRFDGTGTSFPYVGLLSGIGTFGNTDASPIRFMTNSAERMRIDSSGNVGIGTTSPAKQLHITKAAKADIGTLTDGATITPDFDANQNFSVTLAGNRTLANPSNIDAGQTGSIFVVQDGTGSRTLSFGSYWDFAGGTAPTLSTAAGAVDRIDYIVRTGTSIHAVATLNLS
jgi:hypothetical protein